MPTRALKVNPTNATPDEARRGPTRPVEDAIMTTRPTTDRQLTAIAQHIPVLVPLFRGVLMRSEAAASRLARPCAFIVNLADSPGTHWCDVYSPASDPARWIDFFCLPPPTDLLRHLRRVYGGILFEDVGRQPLSSMSCGQRAILALARFPRGSAHPAAVFRR